MSSLCGPTIFGKRAVSARTIPAVSSHRKRRLGHEGQPLGIAHLEPRHIRLGLDQQDLALGQLPHGADRLGVAGMADHHDLEPVLVVPLRLDMHLGDQRAGGVHEDHLAPRRFGRDRLGHAMGREDHRPVRRTFVELLDEDGTQFAQPVHDILVVHDLVAHVDRGAPFLQRHLDDLDRTVHARAESARRGKVEGQRRLGHRGVSCRFTPMWPGRSGKGACGRRSAEEALGHGGEHDVPARLRHGDQRQEDAQRRVHHARRHRQRIAERRP
jgi:hypothetical protein